LPAVGAGIEESGNPRDIDAQRDQPRYSPYDNIAAHVCYPPVLFVTSSGDNRVHPGDARKITAKMQALGHHQVWLLEDRDGGNRGCVLPEAFARTQAITREFLWSTLAQGHGEAPAGA
jgi:prolyl oligopeptidase